MRTGRFDALITLLRSSISVEHHGAFIRAGARCFFTDQIRVGGVPSLANVFGVGTAVGRGGDQHAVPINIDIIGRGPGPFQTHLPPYKWQNYLLIKQLKKFAWLQLKVLIMRG